MTIKAVVLYVGCANASKVGSVVFAPDSKGKHPGFKTKVEALESLYSYLFDRYCVEYCDPFVFSCCGKAYDTEYGECKFCTKCGKELRTVPQLGLKPTPSQIAGFIDWVYCLPDKTSGDFINWDDDEWWPFTGAEDLINLNRKEVCIVPESGDTLAGAFLEDTDSLGQYLGRQGTFKDLVNVLCV